MTRDRFAKYRWTGCGVILVGMFPISLEHNPVVRWGLGIPLCLGGLALFMWAAGKMPQG